MLRAALVIGALLAFTFPALAQQSFICAPREEIKTLIKEQGEGTRDAMALSKGSLIEIYSNDKNQFALVVTGTDGTSCIVLQGTDWTLENSD